MSDRQIIRVIISGRVQGVSYRAWAVKTASQLKLSGWVRNVNNGTVEAVFSGEASAVQAMMEACRRGPVMARVDRIEYFPYNEPIDEGSFTSRPTV